MNRSSRWSSPSKKGRRYRAGPVKVIGTKQADGQRLAHWITLRHLPEKGPKPGADKEKAAEKNEAGRPEKDDLQWKVGEPVTFVPWTWKKLETRVRSGLAAQGFHFPKFEVQVLPDPDSPLAADSKDRLAALLGSSLRSSRPWLLY